MKRWRRKARPAPAAEAAPEPRFKVFFSQAQAASALWDCGEDELVDRMLQVPEAELRVVQSIAARYEDPTFRLPIEQRITHNHVFAFAAITHFEGALRPLARSRRRPQRDRPPHLIDPPPVSPSWTA